jgi:GPH family glycoside/pentoside/hexuronide:cation symporter
MQSKNSHSSDYTPSTGVMASYGTGKYLSEFFAQAFGLVCFKYYETIVFGEGYELLPALGFVIYAVWNAFNDPIVGYLTEKRTTRLTTKWGRRFPWILGGSFFYVFSFILIFTIPPFLLDPFNALGVFIWMVITTCLFDTLYSLWDVNYQSIFPDRFRGENIRKKAIGIATIIGVFGIAIGSVLPTLVTDYEIADTYILNAIIFACIGLIFVFLLIPGVRETPEMINRYLIDRKTEEQASFIRELKLALRERNFLAWIVLYFFYQSAVVSMTASIQYIGDYILAGEELTTTFILAGYLIAALLFIPFWLYISKKIGSNQKMLMITALAMAIVVLPMTFNYSFLGYFIFVFLFGAGFGGYWMLMTPALADVIDNIVVKTKRRNDGIYMGFRAFFGRFAFAVQAISFWIVHEITGFIATPGAEQTDLGRFGINIHTALIPAILLILGVLVFWKLNTLTLTKVEENKRKLEELGL